MHGLVFHRFNPGHKHKTKKAPTKNVYQKYFPINSRISSYQKLQARNIKVNNVICNI